MLATSTTAHALRCGIKTPKHKTVQRVSARDDWDVGRPQLGEIGGCPLRGDFDREDAERTKRRDDGFLREAD